MHDPVEELLEAIWCANEQGDSTLAAVQRCCHIEPSEDDLEMLHKRDYISREADRLLLTYSGRRAARSVVRRHRLAESLFATVLHLSAEKREQVACEVEHTLLPELEEGICTLLGHPTVCPSGKPIPPGRCCDAKRSIAATAIVQLTSLRPGERGRISYIKPKHHSRLHRLTSFGLTPGTIISLHQRSPALCLRYEGTELAIDHDVAEDIYVAKIE